MFWVLTEGLVELDKGWSVHRLQGPAGEHEAVDAVGTTRRLV